MGANTGIEWADATWNPIIGCSRVSEGCRNCYAEQIAGRFGHGKETVYSGLTQIVNGRAVWTGQIKETKKLLEPLTWKKPKRVFVNSMSDLFHENVTDEQRDRIFAVMALCPQHTFQVLTKRPGRMLEYMGVKAGGIGRPAYCRAADVRVASESIANHVFGYPYVPIPWPLMNVWLGVSVENQKAADERIPLLLQAPAAVRFLSCEPLLGPLDLGAEWLKVIAKPGWQGEKHYPFPTLPNDQRTKLVDLLDWVICGGESGPGARPMHPEWAQSLRDQCQAAGVPFFFKQWGEWLPAGQDGAPLDCDGEIREVLNCSDDPVRVGKHAAGALLDGVEWKQFPEAR
jgi:protein gp37